MRCSSCSRDLPTASFSPKDYTQNKNGKYPLARGKSYICKQCRRDKAADKRNHERIKRTEKSIAVILTTVTARLTRLEQRINEIEKKLLPEV